MHKRAVSLEPSYLKKHSKNPNSNTKAAEKHALAILSLHRLF